MKILHTHSKYLVQDNSHAPSEKCKIADTSAKRDISKPPNQGERKSQK